MTSCPGCGAPYETPCAYCGARRTARPVEALQSDRIARTWSDELKRLYTTDPALGIGLDYRQIQQAPPMTAQQQYALMQAQTMKAPVGITAANAFGAIFGGLR